MDINDIVRTEELMKYIFKKQVQLESIGHNELGRNAVYYVPEVNLILKLCGEKVRWGREVASFKHLEGKKDLGAPEMVDHGIFGEQTYWLLTKKCNGIILMDIIDKLDQDQRLDLYKEMGSLQARFHTECRVDIFGDWDANGEIVEPKESYFSFAKDKNDNQTKRIISKGYPDTNLFRQAAEKLKILEHTIKDCNIFSLCHNDFSSRNILVENIHAKWKITGLIDFEKCYPSDPESDFTRIFLDTYMKKEMDSFLSGYAEICPLSNGFHEKTIYYLMAFCLEVCSWSFKVAPDYYHQSKKMLEYLVNSLD